VAGFIAGELVKTTHSSPDSLIGHELRTDGKPLAPHVAARL
jgi:hypothetical protein